MHDLTSPEIIAAMERAAREASVFQLSEFRKRSGGWGDTKAAHEFVSFVDVESEKIIRKHLDAALPGAGFYGEETEQRLGEWATWIVDPVDGTTNYLSGYEHWCVSIGLLGADGRMYAGLVYKPHGDEMFTAARGKGAFRNGKPLPRAKALAPHSALIAMGTPFRSPETMDFFFETVREIMRDCRDVRRTGSAALDLAYVGAGFFQGFWEIDLQSYDVAGGIMILEECGYEIVNFQNGPYRIFEDRGFITGRPQVRETLYRAVSHHYGDLR